MLILPLCEQLIGHCTAHQAVSEGETVGLDASVWHSVHLKLHLATPSQLAVLEEKRLVVSGFSPYIRKYSI